MNARVLGAAALAAASVASTGVAAHAAVAKPKPACYQVTDDTGDAIAGGGLNPAGAPSSDNLDIVSADIATGKKNVVGVIRLKTAAKDTFTTGGSVYTLSWTSGGVNRSFSYRTYVDGSPADAVFDLDTTVLDTLVPIAATVTPANGTITFSMPRKIEPSLKKPKSTFTDLLVRANMAVNRQGGYTSTGFDTASSPRKYVDLSPTCLKGV